jgi:hypothetical protein
MIRSRLKAHWAAMRPDAEEAEVLRAALEEVERMWGKQPFWTRVFRNVVPIAAIALVGWVGLTLL